MPEQKSSESRLYGRVFLIVICVVIGMIYLSDRIRDVSPTQPPLTVETGTSSSLAISSVVIKTECEDSETIDYSVVEMRINGGQPPYDLTITNSKFQTVGPFKVTENNEPIQIKIYGGDYFSAQVHSSDKKDWSATISLPSEAEICKILSTATLPPNATAAPVDTPFPTDTEVVSPTDTPPLTDTPLPTDSILVDLTALDTQEPEPGKTQTAKPPQVTHTSKPQSSKVPEVQPSNTTHPQSTNTHGAQSTNSPVPQATNTPRPQSTSTQVAQPTNTLIPQPSNTPRPQYSNTPPPPSTLIPTPINPNPHECEDGLDNDGDGKTDYPADPQCNKPSDQHEDK